METSKTVTYQTDDGLVRLMIVRSNAVTGMRRSVAMLRGAEMAAGIADESTKALATFTYPDLIAPVVQAKGKLKVWATPEDGEDGEELELRVVDFAAWPVVFEDFCLLPDDLILQWESAVYALNPHWDGSTAKVELQEKKDAS